MALALLGVVAMQYFYLQQSFYQKSLLFDESVKAALNTVASKAEKKEVLEHSKAIQQRNQEQYKRERNLSERVRLQEEIEVSRRILQEKQKEFRDLQENLFASYPHAVYINNSFFETYINNPVNNQYVVIDFGRNSQGLLGNMLQDNYIEVKANKLLPLVPPKDDSVRYLLLLDINPLTKQSLNNIVSLPPRTDVKLEQKIRALEQELKLLQAHSLIDTLAILGGKSAALIEDFAVTYDMTNKPIRDRVDIDYLEKEMEYELMTRGIFSTFGLEVSDKNDVIFSMTAKSKDINFKDFDKNNPEAAIYSVPLFREDLQQSGTTLTLYFPNKQSQIMSSQLGSMVLSITLVLIIIGCFAYTIYIILRQKKMSEMKTDFINNMTHEFKTPVATIMIASESLKDPEINADTKRVERLAGIIYDENVRLGNHIERVLNIAKIEKENLNLVFEPLNINDLVEGVAESMSLQFQKYGAKLILDLKANPDEIVGDELHLSNVVFNLVDNALKYGKDDPFVKLSTHTQGDQIVITVEDNGIGMSKDQQSRIFEQFYRIHTGNLHDVKGFGLGLSYVSDIVKRMKGKISVKSEKNKGSTFEVILPIKNK